MSKQLSKEQVEALQVGGPGFCGATAFERLCNSHEALRNERDRALANRRALVRRAVEETRCSSFALPISRLVDRVLAASE